MGSVVLPTLRRKREVDTAIRDTLDKVLVLRFGRASDAACLQLDDVLAKASWDISKFATVALVDMDSEEIQVYVDYFDITLVPAIIFFFNAHHMKMDSGTPDHTKWIGSFSSKQDFIDVVEFRPRLPVERVIVLLKVVAVGTRCQSGDVSAASPSTRNDFLSGTLSKTNAQGKFTCTSSCPNGSSQRSYGPHL
uniref:Thioredoxin-like protein 4B n=1 Tax=Aegilops tauschii TaxID=37682 RepID=M8B4J3_AEGTA